MPAPNCALCGNSGNVLYQHHHDRLFGAAGSWSVRHCSSDRCGLLWLDPMPLPDEIGKAYERYYTHQSSHSEPLDLLRRAFRRLQRHYLARKYKYRTGTDARLARLLGCALYLLPLRRHEADLWIRSLRAVPGGRLLDVGCGSGDWLFDMQSLGWSVQGVDFDMEAVRTAQRRGLDVFCGAVEQRQFATGQFDAITLNHVLEHVPDPVQTLAECHRILKPGGTLVVTTPNTGSLSHRFFKGDWRGLEPPRHLHMFSVPALTLALRRAGFSAVRFRPEVVTSVIFESMSLRRGRPHDAGRSIESAAARAIARTLSICELAVTAWRPDLADCVGAIATKTQLPVESYERRTPRFPVEGTRGDRQLRREEHRIPEARHQPISRHGDDRRHRGADRGAQER